MLMFVHLFQEVVSENSGVVGMDVFLSPVLWKERGSVLLPIDLPALQTVISSLHSFGRRTKTYMEVFIVLYCMFIVVRFIVCLPCPHYTSLMTNVALNEHLWILLFMYRTRHFVQRKHLITNHLVTYQWVFKYLPKVVVIMRCVIVGSRNKPSKLMTICNIHENSLWRTKKR